MVRFCIGSGALRRRGRPTQWDAVKAILQSTATTLVASLFVALMVLLYLPSGSDAKELSLVDPEEISRLLRTAAQTSRSWFFSGGSGRFLRATTLPALLKDSKRPTLAVTLRAILYDPTNEQLSPNATPHIGVTLPGASGEYLDRRKSTC